MLSEGRLWTGVVLLALAAGVFSGRSLRHDDRSGTNAGEPSEHFVPSSLGQGGATGVRVTARD